MLEGHADEHIEHDIRGSCIHHNWRYHKTECEVVAGGEGLFGGSVVVQCSGGLLCIGPN